MAYGSLDSIIAALGEVLMAAPDRERQRLARAIEAYASALRSPFEICETAIRRTHCGIFFARSSPRSTRCPSKPPAGAPPWGTPKVIRPRRNGPI